MTPEPPSISVIIPCYNRAALVGETLQNLLGQSLPPHEIIVVDDGSTDGSAEVVAAFGGKVRLIRQANAGPGAARNAGFEASTGRFIQFFDSDDLASRNKLAIQAAALERNPDADFAYAPWVRAKIDGQRLTFDGPVMQAGPLPDWKPMLEWQMGAWCLVFQNCLFRREAIERAGRFRTDLMPTEDSEFLVRILLAGARSVFTGECLVFYRVHNHHQITSSGLSSRRRSEDMSRYIEVVGEDVAARLAGMHPSTRREIALMIYRHRRFCSKHGYRSPDPESPLCWETAGSFLLVRYDDLIDRLRRKFLHIPSTTPTSPALCLRHSGPQDVLLVTQAGFQINHSSSW